MVEINDESWKIYKKYHQIRFETSTLRSRFCNCSDTYMLVSGTITITGAGADDAAKQRDERNKKVIFKNWVPFIDCTSKINNTFCKKSGCWGGDV